MDTVDDIRNELIGKILAIRDRDFLEALSKLITSSALSTEKIELTSVQKAMLEMSEEDKDSRPPICQYFGILGKSK
jgi:hypothetical protein